MDVGVYACDTVMKYHILMCCLLCWNEHQTSVWIATWYVLADDARLHSTSGFCYVDLRLYLFFGNITKIIRLTTWLFSIHFICMYYSEHSWCFSYNIWDKRWLSIQFCFFLNWFHNFLAGRTNIFLSNSNLWNNFSIGGFHNDA